MATLIMPLFKRSSPSTIVGLVVSTWVDAIKCFSWRSFAHVGQKNFKALTPALADHNAKPVVVFMRRTCASFFHAFPTAVRWRSWSWRMPMFLRIRAAEISAMAAASGVKAREAVCFDEVFFSAVTMAEPKSLMLFDVRKMYGGQKAEALSREIEFGGHGG